MLGCETLDVVDRGYYYYDGEEIKSCEEAGTISHR
jgi:hypothetical protein